MSGLVEIAAVAFVAQLTVLPGEKVQFIIAGLSTRYRPAVVVAAAGSAFAGWTALEIWFGAALKSALPPAALDGFTAVLFAAFAVMLYRSAPDPTAPASQPTETDGGSVVDYDLPTVLGRDPDAFGSFVPIFAMMAAGEFGDKTQLVTIGLAAQYGAAPGIWVGEMAAIIPVSLANAYFFNRFSHRFDARKAHLFGAGLFTFFAADTVLSLLTDISLWEMLVTSVTNALLTLL